MRKRYVHKLTVKEIEKLEDMKRGSPSKRLRDRIEAILQSNQGKSVMEIHTWLGVTPQSVRAWIRNYERSGIEGLLERDGLRKKKKIDPGQEEKILRWIEQGPRGLGYDFARWTLKTLKAHLAREEGIEIVVETLRQILKRKGIDLRQPYRAREDMGGMGEEKGSMLEAIKKISSLTKSFFLQMEQICAEFIEYEEKK